MSIRIEATHLSHGEENAIIQLEYRVHQFWRVSTGDHESHWANIGN